MLVFDDEDGVETRQDGRHKVDVLLALAVIPAAEDGVGSRKNGAARVQSGRNASLESTWKVNFR